MSALLGSSGRVLASPARPLNQAARFTHSLGHCFSRRSVTDRTQLQHQEREVAVQSAITSDWDTEELWQFPDRANWYKAKFSADDAPDWNPARFVSSTLIAPGVKEVVFDLELSRELVPLRNAYKHVGQRGMIRIGTNPEQEVMVSSAPHPNSIQHDPLIQARGDTIAGETKTVKEPISVRGQVTFWVTDKQPDVFNCSEDDLVEIGPFQGGGLDVRSGILRMYHYPTIVMFCEGRGIATAKALIEAGSEDAGLLFEMRKDVRLFYRAPNEAALCYKDLYDTWEEEYGVKVITSTRDSFSEMFDEDETLEYEPPRTAAVVLTGGDEEAEKAALEACKEAEISLIVRDSEEMKKTKYL